MGIVGDDPGKLGRFQRARHHEFLRTVIGMGVSGKPDRRRGHGQRATRLQRRVRHAAHMPQLEHDAPACRMNRLRHSTPTVDLGLSMDARCPGITLALRLGEHIAKIAPRIFHG